MKQLFCLSSPLY